MIAKRYDIILQHIQRRDHRVCLIRSERLRQIIRKRITLYQIAVVAENCCDQRIIAQGCNLVGKSDQSDGWVVPVPKIVIVQQLHMQVCRLKQT